MNFLTLRPRFKCEAECCDVATEMHRQIVEEEVAGKLAEVQ